MLRRPLTVLSITAEDIADYEDHSAQRREEQRIANLQAAQERVMRQNAAMPDASSRSGGRYMTSDEADEDHRQRIQQQQNLHRYGPLRQRTAGPTHMGKLDPSTSHHHDHLEVDEYEEEEPDEYEYEEDEDGMDVDNVGPGPEPPNLRGFGGRAGGGASSREAAGYMHPPAAPQTTPIQQHHQQRAAAATVYQQQQRGAGPSRAAAPQDPTPVPSRDQQQRVRRGGAVSSTGGSRLEHAASNGGGLATGSGSGSRSIPAVTPEARAPRTREERIGVAAPRRRHQQAPPP